MRHPRLPASRPSASERAPRPTGPEPPARRFGPALVCLALLCVLVVLGCRRGGPVEAPGSLDTRLAEQLLGESPELAFLVDLAGIRGDAVYSRVLGDRRVGKHRDVAWLASRIDRVEVWVAGLDDDARTVNGLAVLRSGHVRESDFDTGGLELARARRLVLPTGVTMYLDDTRSLHTAVFLVDGSVVLAAGAAIANTQNHFSASRRLPTSLDWGRGALSGAYGRRPALGRIDDDAAHVLEASIVWRSVSGGEIVAGASFDDDASTDRAARLVDQLTDVRAEYLTRCPALADVGLTVERSRRSISLRVTGLRALVVAALEERCN